MKAEEEAERLKVEEKAEGRKAEVGERFELNGFYEKNAGFDQPSVFQLSAFGFLSLF